MSERNPIVYRLTYNTNAAKYLRYTSTIISNMEYGTFKYENTTLPFLFDFAEYSINIKNTSTTLANNVLDKIIVEI